MSYSSYVNYLHLFCIFVFFLFFKADDLVAILRNVSRNQLDGQINALTFFNVTSLTTLDLSNNRFSGPIPNLATSLATLKHL
jgi:hypothetical protein